MKHVRENIPAYLDGRLDETDRRAVDAHCASCPECAHALSESETVWRMMGDAKAPEPSRPAWDRISSDLPGRPRPVLQRLSYASMSVAALAAGVLIGAQQYAPNESDGWLVMDEVLSGSMLSGDTTWSMDSALDYALNSTDIDEEN